MIYKKSNKEICSAYFTVMMILSPMICLKMSKLPKSRHLCTSETALKVGIHLTINNIYIYSDKPQGIIIIKSIYKAHYRESRVLLSNK